MNNYEIKQKINNTSIPPTMYDIERENLATCICIAKKDGKYGIIEEQSGKIYIPFEYDNISMGGFSLYLLVKDGKMGLCHIKYSSYDETNPFELVKLIECRYDLITFPTNGESFVFLRKDNEKDTEIQIYFKNTGRLSTSFWNVEYYDRDYIIVVERKDEVQKLIYKTGDTLLGWSLKEGKLRRIFETFGGTVVVAEDFYNNKDTILFLFGKETASDNHTPSDNSLPELLKFCTCKRFIRSFLAADHTCTLERAFAYGFLVSKNGKRPILDGYLERPDLSIKKDFLSYAQLGEQITEKYLPDANDRN